MPDPTRRRVLFLGSAAVAAAVLPGCDVLVLPQEPLLDSIDPVSSNDDFYVYQHGTIPPTDPLWSLVIEDRGTEVDAIDLDFLDSLDSTTVEHTLQCIGSNPRNLLISNAEWTGTTLQAVLDALGVTVDPSVVEIVMYGADDYSTSVPVSDLAAPIRVVWRMNGEALPIAHGAPVRVLIPGRYGTKNVKWVTRIALTDTPYTGYWERRGWSQAAAIQCNGFVLSPGNLAEIQFGPVTLLGTAFAGTVPIDRVEVTTDDGATWQEATLDYEGGPDVWTLWSFDFDPPEPGEYRIRIRVTAEDGTVADMADDSDPYDGYEGGMEVAVRFS